MEKILKFSELDLSYEWVISIFFTNKRKLIYSPKYLQIARWMYEAYNHRAKFSRIKGENLPKGCADALLYDDNVIMEAIKFKMKILPNHKYPIKHLENEVQFYEKTCTILEIGFTDNNSFKETLSSIFESPDWREVETKIFCENTYISKSFRFNNITVVFYNYSKFFNSNNPNYSYGQHVMMLRNVLKHYKVELSAKLLWKYKSLCLKK